MNGVVVGVVVVGVARSTSAATHTPPGLYVCRWEHTPSPSSNFLKRCHCNTATGTGYGQYVQAVSEGNHHWQGRHLIRPLCRRRCRRALPMAVPACLRLPRAAHVAASMLGVSRALHMLLPAGSASAAQFTQHCQPHPKPSRAPHSLPPPCCSYTFHKVFYSSYLYVFTLVLPNSVFILWGWPAQAAQYGNVYTYMPPSVARDISIVLMVLHQVIVFGLFAFPIFYMAEKAVGVHTGAHWKRVLTRLPISLLLWLIALAFPFFGELADVAWAVGVGRCWCGPLLVRAAGRQGVEGRQQVGAGSGRPGPAPAGRSARARSPAQRMACRPPPLIPPLLSAPAGVINDLLGAFTTTFEASALPAAASTAVAAAAGGSGRQQALPGSCPLGFPAARRHCCSRDAPPRPPRLFVSQTFIIPCLAYNIHYQLKGTAALNRAESTKPPNK